MAPWDPWKHLDESPIQFRLAGLVGERGRWVRGTERDEIVVERSLDRRTRREVLAHELVHAERGIGWPDASPETMQLEEERVWRIALRRLAPPEEVAAFVRARSSVGPVTVEDLAEEFDLSLGAAARLAALLVAAGLGGSADDDA